MTTYIVTGDVNAVNYQPGRGLGQLMGDRPPQEWLTTESRHNAQEPATSQVIWVTCGWCIIE